MRSKLPQPPARNRVVQTRVSEMDLVRIHAVATARGETISEYLRSAALELARQEAARAA